MHDRFAWVPLVRWSVEAAADAAGLPLIAIMSDWRARVPSRARFVAYLLARNCGISTPQIGRDMGGRDHATVLHGLRRARDMLRDDPDFGAMARRAGEVLLNRLRAVGAA